MYRKVFLHMSFAVYGVSILAEMEMDVDAFDPQKDEDCVELAAALVAYALGLKTDEILARGRGRQAIVQARQITIYLSCTGLGMSLSRVSRALLRDRSTASHACQVIEDRREDADFDVWCEQLEVGLASVLGLRRMAADDAVEAA